LAEALDSEKKSDPGKQLTDYMLRHLRLSHRIKFVRDKIKELAADLKKPRKRSKK